MDVQNNLLSLEGINAGTISAINYKTGENLNALGKFTEQGTMMESLDILVQKSLVTQSG